MVYPLALHLFYCLFAYRTLHSPKVLRKLVPFCLEMREKTWSSFDPFVASPLSPLAHPFTHAKEYAPGSSVVVEESLLVHPGEPDGALPLQHQWMLGTLLRVRSRCS